MLNVAIVDAVYPPEPVVSAQMGRDLALHLAQDDATVTVLCPFPTRPLGVRFPEYTNRDCVRVEREAGVEIVRLPSFTAPESRLISRMRESHSFGRSVCRYLEQNLPAVDVVYANVWPLLCQALIARFCTRRGIPLIFHVQDIYPESLLGKLPGSLGRLATWPLKVLDRWTVHQACRVVTIAESMRQTYVEDRGLAPEKVVTVTNWIDEGRFAYLPARGEACARYGIAEDSFTFLYLGNIGSVAGVDGLIEAFHAARLTQAQLVIAGDGSAKVECVDRVRRLGAGNIRFISDPDVGNVPLLQSLGHVCLLPLRRGAGMSSIPSKLMAYLLSAKPVLATVDAASDTARCILEAECGWVGEPENGKWLAAKMAEVASLPVAVLSAFGQQGRAYGVRHFSRSAGVQSLSLVIRDGAGRVRSMGAPLRSTHDQGY